MYAHWNTSLVMSFNFTAYNGVLSLTIHIILTDTINNKAIMLKDQCKFKNTFMLFSIKQFVCYQTIQLYITYLRLKL